MRIITKKNVSMPHTGMLSDGNWHEVPYCGGRKRTDNGFETQLMCLNCGSEYAIEDSDWFDIDFLERILNGLFKCPVCAAPTPTFSYWKALLYSVDFARATPGEAAAKMFLAVHDKEAKTRYRIDYIQDHFTPFIKGTFGINDSELEGVTDPVIALMISRICLLGEKVKALEEKS